MHRFPFLLKPIENNEVSIWNYTAERKWKPVHNADAFDNFPGKPKTFANVSFNKSTFGISIGEMNPMYSLKLNAILPGGVLSPFDPNKNHYNKGEQILYNGGVCTAKWWINQSPAVSPAAWDCVDPNDDGSPKPFNPNKDHYNKGDKISHNGGVCTANWWINVSPAVNAAAWSCSGTNGGTNNDNGNDKDKDKEKDNDNSNDNGNDNDNDNGNDNGNDNNNGIVKEAPKPFDPNRDHYNKGDEILYNGGVCTAKWWINVSPAINSFPWDCGSKNADNNNNNNANNNRTYVYPPFSGTYSTII